MDNQSLCHSPLKMKPNRVWRAYTGGLLLDQWQGQKKPQDANVPEEWIASTVPAKNIHPIANEGLSVACLPDGTASFLADILAADPTNMLGVEHAAKYGSQMAVLIKMIDSSCRLVIQVHPDKMFAHTYLGSDYGKTEAWYILGVRPIDGEEPYVLMGFKPWVTREIWTDLFNRQDISGMINAMHRISVKAGDGFLIEGGLPHAIGSGCLLIEIQEPTDLTMRLEKLIIDGVQVTDDWCTQGLGFEKMLDCFHFDTDTQEGIVEKCAIRSHIAHESEGGSVIDLGMPTENPYFYMKEVIVSGRIKSEAESTFSVAVVISGTGKLVWDQGEIVVNASDELFLPASLGDISWENTGEQNLKLIRCYPPK